jgi:hypothetical protein
METEKSISQPSLIDINRSALRAHENLKNGNIDQFFYHWKVLFDIQRPFSWAVGNSNELLELTKKLNFLGIWGSTEECANYIWAHERAHQLEATGFGIRSVIRISDLMEPHHSRFSAYCEIDAEDLERVSERKASKLMYIIGSISLAPHMLGLGYKAETDLAKDYLKRARTMRIKEFFGAKR